MDEHELMEAMEIAVSIALTSDDAALVELAADPMRAAHALLLLAQALVKLGGNTIRPRTTTRRGV